MSDSWRERLFPREGGHFADVEQGKATMGSAADPEGERQAPSPPQPERTVDLNAAIRAASDRHRVYEPTMRRPLSDGFDGRGPVVFRPGIPGAPHDWGGGQRGTSVPAVPKDDLIEALREAGARQRGRHWDSYRPTILRRG